MRKYLIIIVLFLAFLGLGLSINSSRNFVTSKYSKYCYNIGKENHNIKIKIYYKTLEDCGKPLKIYE